MSELGQFQDAFTAAPQLQVSVAACPLFAEFVERGVTGGRQLHAPRGSIDQRCTQLVLQLANLP